MSPKSIIIIACIVVGLVIGAVLFTSAMGICDAQEWIIVQPVIGAVRIQDNPGPYWKGFAKTWDYSRNIEFRYNDDPKDGDEIDGRIKVTFNDGGEADVSTYIRLQTPITSKDRIAFHQQFGGNKDNIKASIKSFMIDALKSTSPLMSASEHQTARKSEFRQLVLEQLSRGLYDMNREQVTSKLSPDDEASEEITIIKTTIRFVDGKPVITTPSPLIEDFKMKITQFSVTGTDYDVETRKQFAAKKKAYLAAEQAKAERSQEVQERLMIIEKGKREKSEAEAAANVLMATAVIAAELEANVALQVKIKAETVAGQALAVALVEKEQAQIELDKAKLDGEAVIVLAKAEQEKIRLAGAITELELALIDAEVKIKIGQAEHFSKIAVPSTVIGGSTGGVNGESGGNVLQDNLMSIFMLKMINGGTLDDFGTIKSVDINNRRTVQQKTSSVTTDSDILVAQK